MRIRREEHMAGGNGHVIIKEILDAEQLNGKMWTVCTGNSGAGMFTGIS